MFDSGVLRSAMLAASRSPGIRRMVEGSRLTAPIVGRFVAGTTVDEVVAVARRIAADRLVTIHDWARTSVTRRRSRWVSRPT